MGFSTKHILLVFLTLVFLLSSCKKPRTRLVSEAASTELENLADSRTETEYKYHELGKTLADLLKEALAMGTDSQMLAHLNEYTNLNEEPLKQLSAEIDDWQKTMDEEDRLYFIMRIAPKKYARDLERYKIAFDRRAKGNKRYLATLHRLMKNLEIRR